MSLKYDVNISGEPAPKVEWSVDGQPLRASDRVTINNVDYNSKLAARKMKRSDAGEYTILATNSSGRDSVTVTVNVLDKPSKPEGPLQVRMSYRNPFFPSFDFRKP
jgi:hypothetical protein